MRKAADMERSHPMREAVCSTQGHTGRIGWPSTYDIGQAQVMTPRDLDVKHGAAELYVSTVISCYPLLLFGVGIFIPTVLSMSSTPSLLLP